MYMNGVVREENASVMARNFVLLALDKRVFQLSQLLYVNDITLVITSQEKLCRLESEFTSAYISVIRQQ